MTSLTPLELAIMKSLWKRQRARVKDVHADLLPRRKLAYTTVLTVLDRLFHKGVVTRTKESRAHVYVAALSEERARDDAVTGVVDDYFSGSRRALADFLLGRNPAHSSDEQARTGPAEPVRPEPVREDALPEPLPEAHDVPDGRPIDEALL